MVLWGPQDLDRWGGVVTRPSRLTILWLHTTSQRCINNRACRMAVPARRRKYSPDRRTANRSAKLTTGRITINGTRLAGRH